MNSISSNPRFDIPTSKVFGLFVQLVSLEAFQWQTGRRQCFYERIWSPVVTLWYLLWQRLQYDGVLLAVVNNARRGGADALRKPGAKPLSAKIKSRATVAYSNARQRLPLAWMRRAFELFGKLLRQPIAGLLWHGHQVQWLDGSTVRLRPHGNIPKRWSAASNQHGKSYWCLLRVVAGFCAHSGLACASALGPITVSEQTLAVRLILQSLQNTLIAGDRNFGVWRVVRAAVQARGQALVRLTKTRARRLLGRDPRTATDQPVCWTPTRHDQVDPGLEPQPVQGRLLAVLLHRRGFRDQWLFLFTTLVDTCEYSTQELVALYGMRWQVEVNLRHLKEQMGMDCLEVKSARMALKEWYAGLMAYNLIRGVMLWAAVQKGVCPFALSFAQARRLVVDTLRDWFCCGAKPKREVLVELLLSDVAASLPPKRRKERPPEPRARRRVPETYPSLKGSRTEARRKLQESLTKN